MAHTTYTSETRAVSLPDARGVVRHICVTLTYDAGQRAEFEAFETFSFKSSRVRNLSSTDFRSSSTINRKRLQGYQYIAILNMIFVLLISFAQANLVIRDDYFGMYLYSWNGEYTIMVRSGVNFTRYSYPIEPTFHLTYEGEFRVNDHLVNIVNKSGTITPPILVQQLFSPVSPVSPVPKCTKCNDSCTINTAAPPPLQVCYNFSTERITLKAVIGFLVLIFLASHGPKIRTTFQKAGSDLLRPKFTGRFSRARSPVAGSQTAYSHVKEEPSVWFSENLETLYETSTIPRSEKVSQSVC